MRGHLQRLLRDKGLLALLPCCATILWIAGAAIAAGNGGQLHIDDQSDKPIAIVSNAQLPGWPVRARPF